jgi:hypothetical protein
MPRWEDDFDEPTNQSEDQGRSVPSAEPASWGDDQPGTATDDSRLPRRSSGEHESSVGSEPDVSFLPPDPSAERTSSPVKVSILGGVAVGKSCLFQAMVYRTVNPDTAGALSYFIRNKPTEMSIASDREGVLRRIEPTDLLRRYRDWSRLPATTWANQTAYRLRLSFSSGLLGRTTSAMDIELLDGAGELFEMEYSPGYQERIWNQAFGESSVVLFCLPIWALFPDAHQMVDQDWRMRDRWLQGFSRIVVNCRSFCESKARVRTVLALTMADDRRSALKSLRNNWITPVQRDEQGFLRRARTTHGIMKYLETARQISNYLYRQLDRIEFQGKFQGPAALDFGRGLPFIVPMSAFDGEQLDTVEAQRQVDSEYQYYGRGPVPAHVELPLLLALCEYHNALM